MLLRLVFLCALVACTHAGRRGKGRRPDLPFWSADSESEDLVRRLGTSGSVREWVQLQVSHPAGRGGALCASGCGFEVHHNPLMGGYCCGSCCMRHHLSASGADISGLAEHGDRCARCHMESSDQPTAVALPCSEAAFSESALAALVAAGVSVPSSPADASVLPVPQLPPLYDTADAFDSSDC